MSLATRCTACDTVFRVVQDQLKVSEGWVRCGRCQGVFNALEGLFDLEPEQARVQPQSLAVELPSPSPAAAAPPWPDAAMQELDEPALEEQPPSSKPIPFDETPASRVAARDRNDFADAQFNSALLAEAGIDVAADETAVPSPDAAPPEDEPAPQFLRQAERQARWERPRTVLALWLLCGVLLLALALQASLHFRDLLATVAPPLRPALMALCEVAGCNIEPLRHIDDIVVDSSTLASAPGGDAVRLSVVLRNRGPLPLAMPSIELTLTDASGQMLVRRVLSPADFGTSDPTLPAASEHALQLVLATGNRRASGYTVEPFYP